MHHILTIIPYFFFIFVFLAMCLVVYVWYKWRTPEISYNYEELYLNFPGLTQTKKTSVQFSKNKDRHLEVTNYGHDAFSDLGSSVGWKTEIDVEHTIQLKMRKKLKGENFWGSSTPIELQTGATMVRDTFYLTCTPEEVESRLLASTEFCYITLASPMHSIQIQNGVCQGLWAIEPRRFDNFAACVDEWIYPFLQAVEQALSTGSSRDY